MMNALRFKTHTNKLLQIRAINFDFHMHEVGVIRK